MRRSTTSHLASRTTAGFSRATVTKTDVDPKLQQGNFGMFSGETSSDAEVAYPYGWVSRVHGPREMEGRQRHAESYALSATGNRSHPVFLPPSDRRFKPPVKLEEGESLNYDDQDQMVHIGRDRVTVSSPKEVVSRIKEPDQKDKSGKVTKEGKVKSTVTQDKDGNVTITGGTVTIKASKIILDGTCYFGGEGGQPAAMKGSIDSDNDTIQSNLAKRVFVK